MTTQVIVLNGGSSAGKSRLARCLQDVLLPRPWLSVSVDDLVDALPAAMRASAGGIKFAADGGVQVGDGFRALETAWMAGVAAMVRAGANTIVDDVFLGGAESQRRWRDALTGLAVLWVGVRCAAEVAERRELARGDRIAGMAAAQADIVHQGVAYDVEVDTTHTGAPDCARAIAGRLLGQPLG